MFRTQLLTMILHLVFNKKEFSFIEVELKDLDLSAKLSAYDDGYLFSFCVCVSLCVEFNYVFVFMFFFY